MTTQERRQKTIEFELNYCQHYGRGKGADMICKAGMNLAEVKRVPVPPNGIKWGPCIGGHNLADPKSHCPHWVRRTQEQAEARANGVEKSMVIMEKVTPFISGWRGRKPIGKGEVVICPACGGKLHLSQASFNGHIRAKCETSGCVNFIE